MSLIDIHSHILPRIDDGAKDTQEATELLKLMREQGITSVIATPHFIASEHNLQDFISDITRAKEKLDAVVKEQGLPSVYLGSEVYYFSGIGSSKAISHLCLNNSKYLLLELPFCDIGKHILDDIITLIFENVILTYDNKSLQIYDSVKILDYVKLKYPIKYNTMLEKLQAEKENKEQ